MYLFRHLRLWIDMNLPLIKDEQLVTRLQKLNSVLHEPLVLYKSNGSGCMISNLFDILVGQSYSTEDKKLSIYRKSEKDFLLCFENEHNLLVVIDCDAVPKKQDTLIKVAVESAIEKERANAEAEKKALVRATAERCKIFYEAALQNERHRTEQKEATIRKLKRQLRELKNKYQDIEEL